MSRQENLDSDKSYCHRRFAHAGIALVPGTTGTRASPIAVSIPGVDRCGAASYYQSY